MKSWDELLETGAKGQPGGEILISGLCFGSHAGLQAYEHEKAAPARVILSAR